ncbi:MAG: ImmA/IrrE family metallo-endopeptidase [Oceanobacter sp.]
MNPIKIIKNDDEHQCALARLDALFDLDPAEGSEAADELELLAMLIEQYEAAHFPIDKPSPIEAIEFRMKQQGLKKKDMIEYFGSAPKVSEVLNGKRPLSLNMIRKLYKGLGIPAEILIQDTAMSTNLNDDTDYSAFPLAEMRKRGYFEGFNGSLTELKEYASEQVHGLLSSVGLSVELLSANVNSSNGLPAILMRTSAHQVDNDKQCDPYAQLAWQARVLQLAKRTPIKNRYEVGTVTPEWMRDLAKLSSLQDGPALAVEFLNNAGIQLVFETHLPKTYLDGAVCMDNRQQPVVALTLRHNRLDNFWFTLMHELAHIALHFEGEERWFVDDLDSTSNDPREDQADALAREVLIPASSIPDGLPGTDTDIKVLANRLRITPSIIAGRIRRERSNYSIYKNFFGKAAEVRNLLKEEGLLS